MRTDELIRMKEVFVASLAYATDEREPFVRRECGTAPKLCEEVLRLVRVRRDVGRRLSRCGLASDGFRDATPSVHEPPAPPAAEAREPPAAGEVILARYRLGEVLGAGAFGTVHRAVDEIDGTPVAVKVTALTTARAERWHRLEIATLLRSQVPGVVRLLATGRVGGWAVLVMELLEGAPFPGDDVGTDDVETILTRTAALLAAVARLHAAGIFHRDLKPANVLVGADGRVTVVDLGIAEDESDTTLSSSDGVVAGTPVYMAPERLRGAGATRSTEVFSVGVILVQALTEEVPDTRRPTAPHAEPLHRYPDTVKQRLRDLLGDALFGIVASMVSDAPEARPRDAEAALRALEEALGVRSEIELPRLGPRAPLDAVLDAARTGRAIDVVGPPGAGRSRLLHDVEAALVDEGYLVRWVRPASGSAETADVVSGPGSPAVEDEDRALCARLRRQVADGMVVLVDDADELDASTRDLLATLRPLGAVVRVVAQPGGEAAHVGYLAPGDLETVVRGPERLFHVVTQVSELLWARTRGSPRELSREIRAWCAMGLASWDAGLVVAPESLMRLRATGPTPAAIADASPWLSAGSRDVWDALTLVGTPVGAATLASVLERPERVVRADLVALVDAGFVTLQADGEAALVRGSPFLADIEPATRAAWSERVASRLPARSEIRVRHLLMAGAYEPACREALEAGRALVVGGRSADAVVVLDVALATARLQLPERSDLYGDLLGTLVDAALGSGTRSAVALAAYHENLAPVRTERVVGWHVVLDAAATFLNSDAEGALRILDEGPSLPSEPHERAAHVVACFAGRMTGSRDVARARILAAVPWARRVRNRDARALLAAWTGWLRFDQGRFDAAHRLHARAARLTPRARPRTTSLADSAMAALESPDLEAARESADAALRGAAAAGDFVNEARAELLQRQTAYRSRAADRVDTELVDAARALRNPAIRGTILLNEAAIAWRIRRLGSAQRLAVGSSKDLLKAGFSYGASLADALAFQCGVPMSSAALDRLATLASTLRPIGIASQAVALTITSSRVALPEHSIRAALDWASAAAEPDTPREVLAPTEVLACLEPCVDAHGPAH